jgi:hypothetical protein
MWNKTSVYQALCGLIAGIFLMMHCSGAEQMVPSVVALRAEISPVIDGRLDEPVWQQTRPVRLKNNRLKDEVIDNRLATEVRTCYDDTAIYISFTCNDPDIWSDFTQRDDSLWKQEAVEVFIDVDDIPDTYVEIEISPANILFDSYIVDPEQIDVPATAEFDLPGIQTAVQVDGTLNQRDDTDKSWTVELAIPLQNLANDRTVTVKPGIPMRINFYRLDKNRGMGPAGYAWSTTGTRFHKPSVFGRLVFE